MAANTNAIKFASNLFRARLAVINDLAGVYKPSISRNKEKLMEAIKERAERISRSEIAKKMKIAKGYYTLEMAPPSFNEMQRLQADLALAKDFISTGCYKYLTVKQAWLLFLVCLEVGLWFYLGETIGKMHIVGYKVH